MMLRSMCQVKGGDMLLNHKQERKCFHTFSWNSSKKKRYVCLDPKKMNQRHKSKVINRVILQPIAINARLNRKTWNLETWHQVIDKKKKKKHWPENRKLFTQFTFQTKSQNSLRNLFYWTAQNPYESSFWSKIPIFLEAERGPLNVIWVLWSHINMEKLHPNEKNDHMLTFSNVSSFIFPSL